MVEKKQRNCIRFAEGEPPVAFTAQLGTLFPVQLNPIRDVVGLELSETRGEGTELKDKHRNS